MKITLQQRITVTMVLFAIVLIGAFALIQVQNQLKTITIFNSLKGKLTVQMLKNNLQQAVANTPENESAKDHLQDTLDSLKNSGLLETAYVYAPDGKTEAATNILYVDKIADAAGMSKIAEALKDSDEQKGFMAHVDKASRSMQLYAPVFSGEQIRYVVRADFSLGNMAEALRNIYVPVLFTTALLVMGYAVFGFILSKHIIGPIVLLNTASKEIAAGDLNLRIHINTDDELQELSETFNTMAIELKKMKTKAENANPLTKLPGNIVIREEVEKLIKNNRKFTVLYCDLDNFKAFNDNYGINAGDEAIKITANIFKEALLKCGNPGDFIGHEGGDDFILLTSPDKAQAIGDYITSEFDKRIRVLYNKEDLDRGYIMAKARYGDEVLKFPIMTISLAGVTNDVRPISSYGEVTNIAAEVKKKAKSIEGSCLFIDQRKIPWPPGARPPA